MKILYNQLFNYIYFTVCLFQCICVYLGVQTTTQLSMHNQSRALYTIQTNREGGKTKQNYVIADSLDVLTFILKS